MEKEKKNMMAGVPERPDYEKELIEIIKSNKPDEVIRDEISDYHENDIADVLESLTEEEREKLYPHPWRREGFEIFAYLEEML